MVILNPPTMTLYADLRIRTLTKVLHGAAEASSPIRRKKNSKKGFPIWNENIAASVKVSKEAHFALRHDGRTRGGY